MKHIKPILFILLILLLLYGIFYTHYAESRSSNIESFTQCDYEHLILDKTQLNDMKDLLVHLTDFFKKNDIDYFAIGGTLIGCIRHGGFMPHDDDIDIGVFKKDIAKIEKYKDDTFYFDKLDTGDFPFGYKFFKKGSKMFIDVMVFEEKGDKYSIVNNLWANETIHADEIYPLVAKPFGDIEIHVPNKHVQYLDRAFPQWDKKIKLHCEHHKKTEGKCFYETDNLPQEMDIDYDKSKYMCYTKF